MIRIGIRIEISFGTWYRPPFFLRILHLFAFLSSQFFSQLILNQCKICFSVGAWVKADVVGRIIQNGLSCVSCGKEKLSSYSLSNRKQLSFPQSQKNDMWTASFCFSLCVKNILDYFDGDFKPFFLLNDCGLTFFIILGSVVLKWQLQCFFLS